jgi:hypothetical protein
MIQNTNNYNIDILPDEIFVEIFRYLDVKALLNSCRVCKKWETILTAEKFNNFSINFADRSLTNKRKIKVLKDLKTNLKHLWKKASFYNVKKVPGTNWFSRPLKNNRFLMLSESSLFHWDPRITYMEEGEFRFQIDKFQEQNKVEIQNNPLLADDSSHFLALVGDAITILNIDTLAPFATLKLDKEWVTSALKLFNNKLLLGSNGGVLKIYSIIPNELKEEESLKVEESEITTLHCNQENYLLTATKNHLKLFTIEDHKICEILREEIESDQIPLLKAGNLFYINPSKQLIFYDLKEKTKNPLEKSVRRLFNLNEELFLAVFENHDLSIWKFSNKIEVITANPFKLSPSCAFFKNNFLIVGFSSGGYSLWALGEEKPIFYHTLSFWKANTICFNENMTLFVVGTKNSRPEFGLFAKPSY